MPDFPYEDILHQTYPFPTWKARMTLQDRGAQFSPFAALTGFDDAITETARLTEDPMDLADSGIAMLDAKLRRLADLGPARVAVTCFRPDDKKTGGAYVTCQGTVKRLDPLTQTLTLTDGTVIPFGSISQLEILEGTSPLPPCDAVL